MDLNDLSPEQEAALKNLWRDSIAGILEQHKGKMFTLQLAGEIAQACAIKLAALEIIEDQLIEKTV